jgi:hypothetical protein
MQARKEVRHAHPICVRTLKSEGVKIVTEPHRPPWQPGRMVGEFQDSEGNRMMIGSK